jgi:hypothetical protein
MDISQGPWNWNTRVFGTLGKPSPLLQLPLFNLLLFIQYLINQAHFSTTALSIKMEYTSRPPTDSQR